MSLFLTSAHVQLLEESLQRLEAGFAHLPAVECSDNLEALRRVLTQVTDRLQDNFPYPHPFYLGQMLRPPHPVAQLSYLLAMQINPNNHAHDGGRATSQMEREAVAELAALFKWSTHLGHLCSGGTLANFESLWVARELTAGGGVAASTQAHYTHERLSRLLNVPFHAVPVNARGQLRVDVLEELLQSGQVTTVVATLGTTGLGAVDPLAEIVALREKYGFRLHVDAAYGGYFRLVGDLSPETVRSFQAVTEADSIAIDPHKHGLQPYGCGCVLFRDRSVAAIYQHQSPYTYFTSDDLHLGEISLECSRPGAVAAALWATQQLLPLTPTGEFAGGLKRCLTAAARLFEWIGEQPEFVPVNAPELDIVVWMVRSPSSSAASAAARRVFAAAAAREIHLALLTLPRELLEPLGAVGEWDDDQVVCLRACLMKPEHLEWLPAILERLREATTDALVR